MSIKEQLAQNQYLFPYKGGGQRGIVEVEFNASLEAFLGMPILEAFTPANLMLGGTSTGGLMVGGMVAGLSTNGARTIYLNKTPDIFNHPVPVAEAYMFGRGYRYDSQNVFRVVSEALGDRKNWIINDCPFPILITAVGPRHKMVDFTQDNDKNGALTGKALLLDAMIATAVASTYFDQWYVHPAGDRLIGWCKDGGLGGSANPVFDLCFHAFEKGHFDPKKTRILNFGTGFFPSDQVNQPHGLLETISDAVDSLLDISEDRQTQYTRTYYPDTPLITLDLQLPRAIDEADISARYELQDLAKKAAAQVDWAVALGLTKG